MKWIELTPSEEGYYGIKYVDKILNEEHTTIVHIHRDIMGKLVLRFIGKFGDYDIDYFDWDFSIRNIYWTNEPYTFPTETIPYEDINDIDEDSV